MLLYPFAEELIEEAPKSIQERVSDARTFLTSTATGKGITIAGGLFLAATLAIALYRTYQKYSSPRAQRMRVVSESGLQHTMGQRLVLHMGRGLAQLNVGLCQGCLVTRTGTAGQPFWPGGSAGLPLRAWVSVNDASALSCPDVLVPLPHCVL
jgi:hypothetical protein